MTAQLLGWTSSAIIVLGVFAQVYRQWKEGRSHGVSRWLHVAEIAANIGFATYGFLRRDPVVIGTSAMLAIASTIGLGLVIVHRRREPEQLPA